MPCNTPPPPLALGTADGDDIDEDLDEQAYWIVDEHDIEDMPVHDDSILTFGCHTDSVFCCNFNKNGDLAVSGGQDDRAFVWNSTNAETKFECTGHSESVIAADFSHDDSFVATADMDGLVQVWNVNSEAKVCNFDASEISWMEWHNTENILFAGTIDGSCWKWTIPDGEPSLFQSHGFGSSSGKLLPDGNTCVVGYMDGSLKLWNTFECSVTGSVTGSAAHKKSVLCLACHPDNGLILSGSEDGTTKLIKSSTSKVLWTLDCKNGHNVVGGECVESLGFFESHPHAATGTNCGNLTIWDIPAQAKRSTCELGVAIVKLICDRSSHLVYVGTANGEIELYDGRTAQQERKWIGHDLSLLDFTLSRDGEKILTSSDDYTCKIFKVR